MSGRRRLCRLLAFLTACIAYAQQGGITGLVIDVDSGDLIAKAQITLVPRSVREMRPMAVRSDEFGRFQFDGLQPGDYSLEATRTGYVAQDRNDPNQLTVTGQGVDGVVIQMQRGAVISGRVTDDTGEPLAEVSVMVTRQTRDDGAVHSTPSRGARTNDLGEYRLFGLPPGEYIVVARSFTPGPGMPAPEYEPATFPESDEGAVPHTLTLRSGEELTGIDLRMRLRSGP